MNQLGFALSHYLFVLLLTFFAYLFGRAITRKLNYHSAFEEFSFSTALGLGVIAYAAMFWGLLGLLYRATIVATLIGGSILCSREWLDLIQRVKAAPSRLRQANKVRMALAVLVVLAGLAVSIPILKAPLYPPTAFDAIFYHLPAAKIYVEQHALVFTPYLRFAVFPHTDEMLMSLALLFYDDLLAQLVHLLALVVLACSCVAFGRRYFSPRAGWWGAAFLVSQQQVLWLSSVAYVDIQLMLFVALNVYSFWNWAHTRDRRWILISGVFCGLAISVKYTAALFLILFVLVGLFMVLRHYRLSDVVSFATAALVVVLPWFGRNFYYTRNPVYPFFYGVFGKVFGFGQTRPEEYAGFFGDMNAYGMGKSVNSLLLLPWRLTYNHGAFFSNIPVSRWLLFTFPIMAVLAIRNRNIRLLLGVATVYTLFWFYTFQVLRYLVPALPLIGVAAGAALSELLAWNTNVRRLSSSAYVTLGVVVLLCYSSWNYIRQSPTTAAAIPITQQQRDDYLARRLPSYRAYKLLREQAKKDYTIYTIYDENMNYFSEGRFLGDYFGPARYSLIWDKLNSGQALYDALTAFGADYFLVNKRAHPVALPHDETFGQHFRQIYSGGGTLLFELRDEALIQGSGNTRLPADTAQPGSTRDELLFNPGFEEINNGWPARWGHTGQPVVDVSGKEARTGVAAVQCAGADNLLFQIVRVKGGEKYGLSFSARGTGEGQNATLRVDWAQPGGLPLGGYSEKTELSGEWKRYSATVTAPKKAGVAVVYAICDSGSAWMDDFSFTGTRVDREK